MDRDIRIDLLKFFAVLLITNSHMDTLYGRFSILATGGAIGDALFFFCSGYTLFMSKQRSFGNYYKRRIARIYPTVFMTALLASMFWGDQHNMFSIIYSGFGWFIPCIMLYYIPLFFIRKYGVNHPWLIVFLFTVVILVYYLFMDFPDNYNMYGNTFFKWVFFFIFMIQGAYIKKECTIVLSFLQILLFLFLSIASFYFIIYLSGKGGMCRLQVLSLIPLSFICCFFYRLCNLEMLLKIYKSKCGILLRIISNLCLEIYLIQSFLFTDKLNFLFPLNILIVFTTIVIAAYFLRCMSRCFVQTFDSKDYEWKAIFKV